MTISVSTDPDIQTPSTGMLSTDSDHLFESQGAAIAVVVVLTLVVVILCISNALLVLTAGWLSKLCRKAVPNSNNVSLNLQDRGGIGATNNSYLEETVITNQGAAGTFLCNLSWFLIPARKSAFQTTSLHLVNSCDISVNPNFNFQALSMSLLRLTRALNSFIIHELN